jgi:hypothetical protein
MGAVWERQGKRTKRAFLVSIDTNLDVLEANRQQRTQFKSGSWHFPKCYSEHVKATAMLQ